MKKLFTLLFLSSVVTLNAQWSDAYETGQDAGDPWTGWSIDNTNVGYDNVNGVNQYTFTMSDAGTTFTVNLYRQFTITGTPINVSYTVTARDAELRLQYSTDGVSYTTFETHTYGSTLSAGAYSTTYTPLVGTYYIRMQLEGDTGPTSNTANFAKFKIEESTTGSVGIQEVKLPEMVYLNRAITVYYASQDFTVDVFGINGQQVLTSNSVTTDLSGLNQGIYFVRYSDKEGRSNTIKVIR